MGYNYNHCFAIEDLSRTFLGSEPFSIHQTHIAVKHHSVFLSWQKFSGLLFKKCSRTNHQVHLKQPESVDVFEKVTRPVVKATDLELFETSCRPRNLSSIQESWSKRVMVACHWYHLFSGIELPIFWSPIRSNLSSKNHILWRGCHMDGIRHLDLVECDSKSGYHRRYSHNDGNGVFDWSSWMADGKMSPNRLSMLSQPVDKEC